MTAPETGAEPAWIELRRGTPWCSPQQLNRLMRQQGLCLAVAQASVYDEIAQAVPLSPEDEQELLARYLRREGAETEAQRAALLRRKGWQHDDLLYFATKGERLRRFQQQLFGPEAELRFLERKLDLDHVSYSLIRVSDGALAAELHQQLVDQEAHFANLATAHSQGEERHSGGRIGPISLTEAHPEVVRRLRVSQPGQLWPPFFLVNIWLILRLEQWHPASLNAATRQAMVEELFEGWLHRRVEQLLAGETPAPLPLQLLQPPLTGDDHHAAAAAPPHEP